MASQASDVRSRRVVVLVSEGEKKRIAANARAADMTVSDFMRTAAERYTEPTATEALLMKDLLAQLERANAATEASLSRLSEIRSRANAFDETDYRAKVRADMEARPDIDWDRVAAYLGLRPAA
ncbi:MAG TPA: hypothetical protein VF649_06905 [Sphingomonas sp.]|jgi:hypothetical protein|uniref:plasmid mobilization protein n=1 Tax=Sphingomonas sp. TaxID=28214 RepID=UPI002ED897B4